MRKLRIFLTRFLLKMEVRAIEKHRLFAMEVRDTTLRRHFMDEQDEIESIIKKYFTQNK